MLNDFDSELAKRYPGITMDSELRFLGWDEGAVPAKLRAMFDDFVDSSEVGMRCVHTHLHRTPCMLAVLPFTGVILKSRDRKPEPEFYLLACKRNGINPRDAVFLDDLGL